MFSNLFIGNPAVYRYKSAFRHVGRRTINYTTKNLLSKAVKYSIMI